VLTCAVRQCFAPEVLLRSPPYIKLWMAEHFHCLVCLIARTLGLESQATVRLLCMSYIRAWHSSYVASIWINCQFNQWDEPRFGTAKLGCQVSWNCMPAIAIRDKIIGVRNKNLPPNHMEVCYKLKYWKYLLLFSAESVAVPFAFA
jgi:hypothetical protein